LRITKYKNSIKSIKIPFIYENELRINDIKEISFELLKMFLEQK